MSDIPTKTYTEYLAWDRTIRWFHWINVICILGLALTGTIILNGKAIGIGAEGKILLKTVHVLTGYVFATNLVWRIIWAFVGTTSARWRAILPVGKGYIRRLSDFFRGLMAGNPPSYVGHNPLGRLMVTLILVLLMVQGSTGLVIAGTDIYYPPLGNFFADWVTNGDADKMANLTPGSREFVVKESYDEMRVFRKPFANTHVYVFYTLLIAIFLHILAVVISEVREHSGIVSAMFSGKKLLSKQPVDLQ